MFNNSKWRLICRPGNGKEKTHGNAQHRAHCFPRRAAAYNRSLLKFILLSIITLGIYGLVVMTKISTEINTIAGPYDNKKTMNYCLVVLIFSWLTMGIVPLVWAHRFSNRVGSELLRRNLPYQFDAGTFWLWNVLGSLIVVGPFVYTHKLLTAMNMLCTDYNAKG